MSLRTRNNKKRKKVITTSIVIVGILVFFYFGILQGIVSAISMPFLYIGDTAKSVVSSVRTSFIPDSVLLEENRILQERIDNLERELVAQESGIEFSDEEFVSAKVLIRPSQNIYGSLLVRANASDVKVGDVAITNEGAFVGVVDEVSSRLVRITLSSHPGFTQDLSVERSGIPVTVIGTGGGNMKSELPQGADIRKSDVLTDLATGRIVAEVGEVVEDDASAFTTAYMRMPVNVFEITDVLLVPRPTVEE